MICCLNSAVNGVQVCHRVRRFVGVKHKGSDCGPGDRKRNGNLSLLYWRYGKSYIGSNVQQCHKSRSGAKLPTRLKGN